MNENAKEKLINNPFIKESAECYISDDQKKVPRGIKKDNVWKFNEPSNTPFSSLPKSK